MSESIAVSVRRGASASTGSGLSLAAQLDRVMRPPTEAWSLPPPVYSSQAIYDLEVSEIFHKEWLLAGRVDQIPRPGDYFTADFFGHRLVITRNDANEVRCFSRVCLHRGALICEGSGQRRLLVCPYHGWSYDTNGRLCAAPHMDVAQDFDIKSQTLPRIRVEIWQGFIFINLDPDAEPLTPSITGFTDFCDGYRLDEMVLLDQYLEFDSPWNWKNMCENFMEPYHHATPHLNSLQPVFPVEISYTLENHGQPWSVIAMPAAKPEEPVLVFPPIKGLDDWRKPGLMAGIIFPNTLIAFTGDAGLWYQMHIMGPDRFRLRIRFLVPRDTLTLPDFEERFRTYREFILPVHQEDIAVNMSSWTGLCSPGAKQGRLHPKYEETVWQMNQWWCKKMGHLLR